MAKKSVTKEQKLRRELARVGLDSEGRPLPIIVTRSHTDEELGIEPDPDRPGYYRVKAGYEIVPGEENFVIPRRRRVQK